MYRPPIPGIGLVYSIAKIGDINRFPSQAQLGKYAGLALDTESVQ